MLDDAAVVQDGDDVGERQRLFLVVRDEHHGRAERGEQLLDLSAQAVAQARVQRRERLVEQDQPRLRRERAGDGHTLLLAAGELVGTALAEAAEADQVEQLVDRRAAAAPAREPEADVLGDGQVGEEQAVLRHVADAPRWAGTLVLRVVERLAVERDAPASGAVEAGEQAQQRRLAGSRRPEHGREAARGHRQRDVAQHRAWRRRTWRRRSTASVLTCSSPPGRRTSARAGRWERAEIAIISAA